MRPNEEFETCTLMESLLFLYGTSNLHIPSIALNGTSSVLNTEGNLVQTIIAAILVLWLINYIFHSFYILLILQVLVNKCDSSTLCSAGLWMFGK